MNSARCVQVRQEPLLGRQADIGPPVLKKPGKKKRVEGVQSRAHQVMSDNRPQLRDCCNLWARLAPGCPSGFTLILCAFNILLVHSLLSCSQNKGNLLDILFAGSFFSGRYVAYNADSAGQCSCVSVSTPRQLSPNLTVSVCLHCCFHSYLKTAIILLCLLAWKQMLWFNIYCFPAFTYLCNFSFRR